MGGFVYLICDPGLDTYKIGVTRDLASKRLKKLQTGNASELHMVFNIYTDYPFRLETILHTRFKNKRALGEWFYLDHDDVINFEKTCKDIIEHIYALQDNPFFGKNLK